jgi:hypothetical protein
LLLLIIIGKPDIGETRKEGEAKRNGTSELAAPSTSTSMVRVKSMFTTEPLTIAEETAATS